MRGNASITIIWHFPLFIVLCIICILYIIIYLPLYLIIPECHIKHSYLLLLLKKSGIKKYFLLMLVLIKEHCPFCSHSGVENLTIVDLFLGRGIVMCQDTFLHQRWEDLHLYSGELVLIGIHNTELKGPMIWLSMRVLLMFQRGHPMPLFSWRSVLPHFNWFFPLLALCLQSPFNCSIVKEKKLTCAFPFDIILATTNTSRTTEVYAQHAIFILLYLRDSACQEG